MLISLNGFFLSSNVRFICNYYLDVPSSDLPQYTVPACMVVLSGLVWFSIRGPSILHIILTLALLSQTVQILA